jgi:hypothetical protein
MNAYFFKMTNEERNNILDQHKEVYDGYVTNYAQPSQQPLYVQDYANDKGGINVNNRGEVSTYSNLRINEMRHDGKSTGLFSDEEPVEEGFESPGSIYEPEETFESEFDDEDEDFMVSVGAPRDMIGDGPNDLDHGVFDDTEGDDVLVSPEVDDYEEDLDNYDFDITLDDLFNLQDDENELEENEKDDIFNKINESLDMFRRFTKYN